MSLTPKFVRAHLVAPPRPFSDIRGDESLGWLMKLTYEFWGFCVNGGTDLTTSLGFASGGINMPAGFENGSLLMSGTQGYTVVGEPYFRDDSADFTSGSTPIKDRYLVTWQSGSTSTDDSVYRIMQVVDSGTIRVDTNEGGTPYSASLYPLFTDRSSINYRIVDIHDTATSLSFASGNYLVMDLVDAPTVNSGQLESQFKLALNSDIQVCVSVSPSGSWDGSGFTDETTESSPGDWVAAATTGRGYITMMAANDFFITHFRGIDSGWNSTAGSGYHVEIPYRIYPRIYDPNPIAYMVYANDTLDVADTGGSGFQYGGGWKMHHPVTEETETWFTLIRNPHGDYWETQIYASSFAQNATSGRFNMSWYNPITDKQFISDVILGLQSADAFHMGRVRMRRWRYTTRTMPQSTRMGENGEWIHAGTCVVWPWDNAILPRLLLPAGT